MPGIADMLVQSALNNAGKAPDISGAYTRGAQLALAAEAAQTQRAELEHKKAEAGLAKVSKTMDLIKMAHEYEKTDPAIAASLWKNAIPAQVGAFGTGKVFTPEFLETAQKSPETRMKVLGYQVEIQDRIANLNRGAGETPQSIVAEIEATISDPIVRASLDTDRIIKAVEQQASEVQLNKRAKMQADAMKARGDEGRGFQASQKVKDRAHDLSKEFIKLDIPGMDSVLSSINKEMNLGAYKEGQAIPGIGGTDGATPINQLKNPQARRNRQLAQNLANGILKLYSGQAVSEGEARRSLTALGFDQSVDEQGLMSIVFRGVKSSSDFINGVNDAKKRINQIKATAKAGAGPEATEYFETNFKNEIARTERPKFADLSKADQDAVVKAIMKKTGKPEKQVREEQKDK